VLFSLSFSLSNSSAAAARLNYQAQWKVLAFSPGLLTTELLIAIYPRILFCLSKIPKKISGSYSSKIILPQKQVS
jgi:hypothetical protein